KDDSSEELIAIVVPYSSRYANAFLNCCSNFDIRKPITFRPYSWKPDDRKTPINSWVFKQDGQKILPKYPKGSPELPPLVQKKFGGVLRWDDTDQMDFLWNKAAEWGLRVGLFGPPEGAAETAD